MRLMIELPVTQQKITDRNSCAFGAGGATGWLELMNTPLLSIAVLLIALRLWRKRDWYVVETRICYRDDLSSMLLTSRRALDKKDLSARHLRIQKESAHWVSIKDADGSIVGSIIQEVVSDLRAAHEYSQRPPVYRFITETQYSDRVWVLRVVARTRQGAFLKPGAYKNAGHSVLELASVPASRWYKGEQ